MNFFRVLNLIQQSMKISDFHAQSLQTLMKGMVMNMQDGQRREIDYLRISITDRCNLRCVYCMPEEGITCKNHDEILTYEELERLCKIFAKLGVTKIKLTGGEPLIRKDCSILVDRLKQIKGIELISITTNGVLLKNYIEDLVKAGLNSVNISLDSMSARTTRIITRRSLWEDTMKGIEEAFKYPSLTVKINCVPIKGMNDADLIKVAELARNHVIHVRFIELMPIGLGREFEFRGEDDVIHLLEETLGKLTPSYEGLGNGPAHYFSVPGYKGRIGFISARTHKFCNQCNRIRLTSEGFLKTCLQYNTGCDLREMIRSSSTDKEIVDAIKKAIYEKPREHHFENIDYEASVDQRKMFHIGG